jgi:hypothetical protein
MYYQQTLVMLLLLLGILCLIKSVIYLSSNDSIKSTSPLKQPIRQQQLTGNIGSPYLKATGNETQHVVCNSCFAGIMQ